MLTPINKWLSEAEISNIYSSEYWNNLEEEKKKEWWIIDGNYNRCLNYLQASGLMDEYIDAENFIASISKTNLVIADLASGIGWTSALLSKLSNVAEIYSVEISEHRLNDLFIESIKMMQGDENKIHRCLGSFYDLKFEDNSLDIVFLSQAFHHADRPLNLLVECDRVLKPGGSLIIIGEHYFSYFKILKGFVRSMFQGKFHTRFHYLFPTDHDLGDHYYSNSDYDFMFRSMGLKTSVKIAKTGKAMYMCSKPI